jgi:glucan phosphoethanolaminetransferase (alkaline phosphatase superfamily)
MREVPKELEEKRIRWKNCSEKWFWRHNALGTSLTLLYTCIAAISSAAPWPHLFWRVVAIVLPIFAAICSFVMMTYGAQAKGKAFETAARELGKAIALYRYNQSLPDSILGQAEARAIDLLSMLKPS